MEKNWATDNWESDIEESREYYQRAAENIVAAFVCKDGRHMFVTAYDVAGNWHARCQCGEQEQSGGPQESRP